MNPSSIAFLKILLYIEHETPLIEDMSQDMTCMPQDITCKIDDNSSSVQVQWKKPTITDNSGSVTNTSNHKPGDHFPIGVTTVIYTAEDRFSCKIAAFKVIVTGTVYLVSL